MQFFIVSRFHGLSSWLNPRSSTLLMLAGVGLCALRHWINAWMTTSPLSITFI